MDRRDESSVRRWFRAIPLPLMAAFLLIGAGWRIAETNIQDTFSTALTTAAMILIGAWIREYAPIVRVKDEEKPELEMDFEA